MVAFLLALVALLSVAVLVLLRQWQRAEVKAARYRQLALRGLAEMNAAIIGAAAQQV